MPVMECISSRPACLLMCDMVASSPSYLCVGVGGVRGGGLVHVIVQRRYDRHGAAQAIKPLIEYSPHVYIVLLLGQLIRKISSFKHRNGVNY